MAKIVCIDTGTTRQGTADIGDVVSIHEDDVELGSGYDNFKIIDIPGVSTQEVREKIENNFPEVRLAFKKGNELSFDTDVLQISTEKVWRHPISGKWMKVKNMKYPISLSTLTDNEVINLRGNLLSKQDKMNILSKRKNNLTGRIDNQEEATELNRE